ncbi:hypothetical protein AN5364.2 [Aspergillus nidulans FGSC A4]|uniref:von Willebrand domain protein (AFU_orthologue AFUA_4G01160) n=1 Tax=Emericella nidulans (strain FGSC A4 / ATCC 38163 / CBS 112.46 / NRRL 194 / M139) TaxID=227321 RepID=Q5B266_EMENI|nr:hypothetical protein [Aspergillus nidulans FGSC A4]EAA62524.1 hypothetical protein AN5364.2 [Aspergillus nidulans FGSC A4]CBF82031.1 TPA: von Willebrand domain protein (AFU_orthologue; AFUA_4G01160) [Aspergillus nidulans FGSC A4]|eukprot:XP_662968.1 hypothetical protein AN5364.2 [Aspergillus nidulans FGSC A4]
MDVLDRVQSGLLVHASVLNSIPAIPKSHISSHRVLPPIDYVDNASFSIPTASSSSINDRPTLEVSLPLLSVSANVDIQGRLCTTTVTQQFCNASSSVSQNAKYVFPIYDGSVVTSFRCSIGNERLLEGSVKAKEAARRDFKQAVSQRKVAVLVEELVPEVFETSVGNIPAQTTVKIEITYANLLKVDNSTGGLVLTIPTSIAPRYGNAPAGYNGNQSILTEGLRINVQASMPAAIRRMESRSHPISVEMGAVSHKSFKDFADGASSEVLDCSKGRATLSDREPILHQDFVLLVLCNSRELSQSQAIAVAQPGQPAHSTIAVTIHPGDILRQNVYVEDFVGEIIFMADRSGSMESKISSLINVMNIFIRSLPEACSFNIASFGSEVTWLWPCSKRYSQENLDVASKHVDSFRANYGGTNIYCALESVLDHFNKQDDVPTNVILLTDGEVWDVDNVIQLVRRTVSMNGSNIRFFSLGIGDRVSHRLVEGIGLQGGGYAEVVPESSMGSWQERVIQMLKAALSPSRLQCNVDLGQDPTVKTSERQIAGYRVQRPEVVRAPHHIPVLNASSHFTLYYMLESGLDSLPKFISLTATTGKGEKLTARLPIQAVAEQSAIHHLAAKALMNDYETGQSWLHSLNPTLQTSNPTGFGKVLEQEAQHLGLRWSVPGKWTSYVAIDRTTAQQHAISLHKADAIEVSQLTKPRHTFTHTRLGPIHTQSAYGYGEYGAFRSLRLGEQRHPSPPSPRHPSRPVPWCAPPPSPRHPHPSSPRHDPPSSPQTPQTPQHMNTFNKFRASAIARAPDQLMRAPARQFMVQPSLDQTQQTFHDLSTPVGSFALNLDSGTLDSSDILQSFDFDAFLNTDGNDSSFLDNPTTGRCPPVTVQNGAMDKRFSRSNESLEAGDRDNETTATCNDPDKSNFALKWCPQLRPPAKRLAGYPANRIEWTTGSEYDSNMATPQDASSKLDEDTCLSSETPPSDFPALETILRMQQADGRFAFLGLFFIKVLREKYDSNALEKFLNSKFDRQSHPTRCRLTELELTYNILIVVYITHEHAPSKALWELQVAKGKQWIKRTIIELLKESCGSGEVPDSSLEELGESIFEEMQTQVLRET